MTKVEYELMTIGEIVEAKRHAPLVFVPVSPIEWHGPHLPIGTDGLHAHHVAVRLAREVGGVVLPTLFAGTETVLQSKPESNQLGVLGLDEDARVVGMDFPGFPVKSLYFEESAFGIAVRDLVRALAVGITARGGLRDISDGKPRRGGGNSRAHRSWAGEGFRAREARHLAAVLNPEKMFLRWCL